MTAMGILLTLVFFASLGAIIVPYKPFGKRRYAAWAAVASFVGVVIIANIQQGQIPKRPDAVSEAEWKRREEICREAAEPLGNCMPDLNEVTKAEQLIVQRAEKKRIAEEERAAEEKERKTKLAQEVAAKVTADARKEHDEYVEMLKREVGSLSDGIEVKEFASTKEGIFVAAALFSAMAKIYEDGTKHDLTAEEQALRETYHDRIVATQVKAFPALRDAWGPLLRRALWEVDVEARTYGTSFQVVEFVGAVFVTNANKKKFFEEIYDSLVQLRFKQVRFKWYKGADEYTYWEIKSPSDSALVIFENGSSRIID